MKRTIIIEIFLLFSFCVLIACAVNFFYAVHLNMQNVSYFKSLTELESSMSETQRLELIAMCRDIIHKSLWYAIPALLAAIATLAAIVNIAIKDFPVFKPLVDRYNAKRTEQKEKRAALKAEQTEIAKQERIAELQAELDELKKDE